MNMRQVDISIIIPTKDRGQVFNKTLMAAYEANKHFQNEILIINDSKTAKPLIPEIMRDRVRIIDNPKQGVASARNLGAANAKYDHLLFMDDDMLITKENMEALLKLIEKYPDTAINLNWEYPSELLAAIKNTQFGRYLVRYGFTSLEGWSKGIKWESSKVFETDLAASYFLSISKKSFIHAGGYNEAFPHAGAEDFEFAKRLKKTGIKCLCDPIETVLHNEEDRVELKPWLERKERSAITRKVAVQLGYAEMAIESNFIKKSIILSIYSYKSFLYALLKITPNIKLFDSYYFFIINRLLSAYLYKGYYS